MTLKTLIVDDEPIARRVLREELELIDDVEVIGEAADGMAAVEKIGSQQPDLVLLDLQMPAMGGLDGVRQLKHSAAWRMSAAGWNFAMAKSPTSSPKWRMELRRLVFCCR